MLEIPRPVAHALIFFAAMGVTAALTPLAMRIALRLGLVDRPAPHKFHQIPTPYLGGVAIALAILATLAAALFFVPPKLRLQFAAIGLGGAAVAAAGLMDDWLTIGPAPRLAVQTLSALGLWVAGVRLTPTDMWPVDLAATVLLVLALTNGVNLLDNMDGLSTGTVAIASLFLYVVAFSQGQHFVAPVAIALAGGCLGFLPFNFNPARVFLGDAGTLFLGFLLSTLMMKIHLSGYALLTRAAVLILIVAVPIFDMALVVISRWRAGRPVFQGGRDHSSHRMVAMGASPRTAALITYAAGLLAGSSAIVLLVLQSQALTWVFLAATAVAFILGIRHFERVLDAPGPDVAVMGEKGILRKLVSNGLRGDARPKASA